MGFPRWCSGKESACRCRKCKRRGFSPWMGKIPWNRKWQPNPVFLPGKFHGQRSLVGYSPWGAKRQTQWAHMQTQYAFMFHSPVPYTQAVPLACHIFPPPLHGKSIFKVQVKCHCPHFSEVGQGGFPWSFCCSLLYTPSSQCFSHVRVQSFCASLPHQAIEPQGQGFCLLFISVSLERQYKLVVQ